MPGGTNRTSPGWPGRLKVAQHAVLGRLNENDPVPIGTAANNPG